MSQIREQVKSEDKVMKDQSKHQSQSDAAKGFGGKYGVQKERQDKVAKVINICYRIWSCVMCLQYSTASE